MSFERHHPNHQVDRNLARARDLRSAYVFACFSAMWGLIAPAPAWRGGGAVPRPTSKSPRARQAGKPADRSRLEIIYHDHHL
jgi:hypothetical protein